MITEKPLTITTWNISEEQTTSDRGRLNYFVTRLRPLNSHLIHFQEAKYHIDGKKSSMARLALLLDMVVVGEESFHQSPVSPNHQVSIGTLATKELAQRATVEYVALPNPQSLRTFGDIIPTPHDRPAIATRFDGVTVINAHHWPRVLYPEDEKQAYIAELRAVYGRLLEERAILAGDLNDITMTDLAQDTRLRNTLPRVPTVEKWQTAPDYIGCTSDLTLLQGVVYDTKTIHRLATGRFGYEPAGG
jgi:endonuclease/exonuclease/phosphatase family metal-dependent hydrolase